MKINEDVWGKPIQSNPAYAYGNKISTIVKNGKIAINTDYDKSIAYVKATNFPTIKCIYYEPHYSGHEISTLYTQNKEQAFFTYCYMSGTRTIDSLVLGKANSVDKSGNLCRYVDYAWAPNQEGLIFDAYPILGLDVSRCMLLVRILCSDIYPEDADDKTIQDSLLRFPIADYYNKYSETYPYIYGCYCELYINQNNNVTAERRVYEYVEPSYMGIVNCQGLEYLSLPVGTFGGFTVLGPITKKGYAKTPSFSDTFSTNATLFFSDNVIVGENDEMNLLHSKSASVGVQQNSVYTICNTNKDRLISIACMYGLPVAESVNSAKKGTFDSSDVHLPIYDLNGDVIGYTTGNGNKDNPYYKWQGNKDAPWNNGVLDANDPNSYTDKIDLNKPNLTTTGVFNRTFAITGSELNILADYLWNADETIFDEIIKGLGLMGNNPIESLIDCRLYPFNVADLAGGGSSQSIVVGRTDTGVQALRINSQNAIIDMGSCTFHRHFKNFLDYEPFTSASLYIPYCGIVAIPTAEFVGKTITAKLIVDVTTGACTAVIFADNIPYLYKNGTIGIDIPMTATNSADYASRIMNGVISGTVNTALGAATGNAAQAIGGAMGLANTALSINNSNVQTTGSSAPACSLWQPQNCYFIIRRPVVNEPENYAHTVGYACCKSGTIGNFSGYTQAINVDLSTINATEEEKDQIQELLRNGVYL